MKEVRTADSRGEVIAHGWRSRTMTKVFLLAGVASAAVYVVGDLVSGLVYNATRPYSFRDQWISELTAYGSPVWPLMVTVITIHGCWGSRSPTGS